MALAVWPLLFCWFLRSSTALDAHRKISDVKILLPFQQPVAGVVAFPVEYKVSVNHGCYRWTSSKPDVVKVTPVFDMDARGVAPFGNHCSSEAVLRSVATAPTRAMALIFAEDADGNILRCQVFVDTVSRLEILTTVRKLSLDETEKVHVQAFDSLGNVFNSLEGLSFQWSTFPSNEVLRVVPLSETNVGKSEMQHKLEGAGLLSDSVQVQGMKTGRATVTVRMDDFGYENVAAATATMHVIETLMLKPSHHVYLAPSAVLQYSLLSLKDSKSNVVSMPNDQYKWAVTNGSVAIADTNMGILVACSAGETTMVATDQELAENQADAQLSVVVPDYLRLSILSLEKKQALQQEAGFLEESASHPSAPWFATKGEQYVIEVEVYDQEHHKLRITDGYNISLAFSIPQTGEPAGVLTTVEQSNFSTVDARHVRAVVTGKVLVTAHLYSVSNSLPQSSLFPHSWVPSNGALSTAQELQIVAPVEIVKPVLPPVLLPWVVHAEPSSYQLVAVGGTGEYEWTSANESVATVGPQGIAAVHGVGATVVTARDVRNALNYASVRVNTSVPTQLQILPSIFEVQVGQELNLGVVVKDPNRDQYDNCSSLGPLITVEIADLTVLTFDGSDVLKNEQACSNLTCSYASGSTCGALKLKGLQEGRSVVRVRFQDLYTETTIFVYAPLAIVSPRLNDQGFHSILVTLGTSYVLNLQGGPSSGLTTTAATCSSRHQDSITPSLPDDVLIEDEATHDEPNARRHECHGATRSYRLTCLAYGTQNISIKVANAATRSLPYPAEERATIWFACARPTDAALSLSTDTPLSSLLELSSTQQIITYAVSNNDTQPLFLSLFYNNTRFDNFSSVQVTWTSDAMDLMNLTSHDAVCHQRPYCECTASLSELEGFATIAAAATGYVNKFLALQSISANNLNWSSPVTRHIRLQLVRPVSILPPSVSAFLHPNNTDVNLRVFAGSGRFRHTLNNSVIARHLVDSENDRLVVILPLAPGDVSHQVDDYGVHGGANARAAVFVSSVSSISMSVRRRVPVGVATPMRVAALDARGNEFPVEQFAHMQLKYETDPSILLLAAQPAVSGSSCYYNMTGLRLGTTSIQWSALNANGSIVFSNRMDIQVFAPLVLAPQRLVLVPGSSFLVQVSGGPKSGAKLHFSTGNTSVATVDESGVVYAHNLGDSYLLVQALGLDEDSGRFVVFSSGSIPLRTSLLSGIEISSPTSSILEGAAIKLIILGLLGESPFSFDSSEVSYSWTVDDTELITVTPVGQLLEDTNPREFGVWATGLRPGTTRVRTRCTIKPLGYPTIELRDSITLSVLPLLKLLSPSWLLLYPGCQAAVITSLDQLQQLRYAVRGSGTAVVEHLGSGNIVARSIGQATILISDARGEQHVSMLVEVQSVAQLTLLPHQPALSEVSIGGTSGFEVQLRDSLGRLFSVDAVPAAADELVSDESRASPLLDSPLLTLSNSGVVRVVPGTIPTSFVVHGVSPGRAVVKVWVANTAPTKVSLSVTVLNDSSPLWVDETPPGGREVFEANMRLCDYLPLRVVRPISPAHPVVLLGGVIQFQSSSSEFYSCDTKAPLWASSNVSVLKVEGCSGTGTARAVGNALITASPPSEVSAATAVRVVELGKISIDVVSGLAGARFLTNGRSAADSKSTRSYSFPVWLEDSHGSTLLSAQSDLVQHSARFTCFTDDSARAFAVVQAHTDARSGKRSCVVTPRSAPASRLQMAPAEDSAATQVSVTPPTSFWIHVRAGYAGTKQYVAQSSAKIPFRAAFSLKIVPLAQGHQHASLSPAPSPGAAELCLSIPTGGKALVEVSTGGDQRDVLVHATDPRVTISRMSGSTYQVFAKAGAAFRSSSALSFVDPLTGQEEHWCLTAEAAPTLASSTTYRWRCALPTDDGEVKWAAGGAASNVTQCQLCPAAGGRRVFCTRTLPSSERTMTGRDASAVGWTVVAPRLCPPLLRPSARCKPGAVTMPQSQTSSGSGHSSAALVVAVVAVLVALLVPSIRSAVSSTARRSRAQTSATSATGEANAGFNTLPKSPFLSPNARRNLLQY